MSGTAYWRISSAARAKTGQRIRGNERRFGTSRRVQENIGFASGETN